LPDQKGGCNLWRKLGQQERRVDGVQFVTSITPCADMGRFAFIFNVLRLGNKSWK
jgi:hypothetical protein